MSENNEHMVQLPSRGGHERYVYGTGIGGGVLNDADRTADTSTVFNGQDGGSIPTRVVWIKGRSYEYVLYGDDDRLPYTVREHIGDNMITAQSQLFNVQSCYGQGLRFYDRKTQEPAHNAALEEFCFMNDMKQLYLEQCTDMKYYYFSVAVLLLSRDGSRIDRIVHKDACNCRFTLDRRYVLYGDFESDASKPDNIEIIPWLDAVRPSADLLVKTGRIPDPKTGLVKDSGIRKFAVSCSFPTVGCQFYPRMNYLSVFRDKWYDIYRLIGFGKRAKIRNSSSPRFQIEIHMDYWDHLCDSEGIVDEEERKARVKREKENIESFVCGLKNAGKTWITGYFIDPNGRENQMVRITNLENGKKEGGDWADDIQEASNILCFAFGVHPNLIGATPGKSSMNNSGSDKRELFTLKQALDTPFRDVLMAPYRMLLHYNGWSREVGVDVPILQLTTLDKGKDAQIRSFDNNTEGEEKE